MQYLMNQITYQRPARSDDIEKTPAFVLSSMTDKDRDTLDLMEAIVNSGLTERAYQHLFQFSSLA